jgi:hypothetical protein
MSEIDLDKLKRSCSVNKSLLTRKSNNIKELLKAGTQCRLGDLKLDLGIFYDRLSNYQEAVLELSMEVEASEVEEVIDSSEKYITEVLRVRVEAESLLATMTAKSKEDIESSSSTTTSSRNMNNIKLPKLQLPSFSGRVLEWVSYWQQFEAAVHISDTIPDVTKYSYLLASLKGDAKQAIEGLSLCADNYPKAVKILTDRFGRKEAIIFHHVQALLTLTTGGFEHRAPTPVLRKLLEQLLVHVRSLETLGVVGNTYGVILNPILLSKLPSDVRLEWSKVGHGKEGDLPFLMNFLEEEVKCREVADAFRTPTSKNKDSEKRHSHSKSHVPTGATLTLNTDISTCAFCNGAHKSYKCNDTSISPSIRWTQAVKQRLCFACLSKSHRLCDNKCSIKCRSCKGRHNTLLCKHKTETQSECKNTQPSSDNGPSGIYHTVVLNQTKKVTECSVFQTAKVLVSGCNAQVEATILFDSGSDKSYVCQNIIDKIGSKWLSSCNITYAPFGGGKVTNVRNVYQLDVRSAVNGSKSIALKAISVPTITVPLYRNRVPEHVVKKLDKLKLADNVLSKETINVDILIGLDQYWSIIKPSIVEVGSNLVAMDTEFGWVVSGSWSSDRNHDEQTSHAVMAHSLFVLTSMSDVSDSQMKRFWDLETLGIGPNDSVSTHPILLDFNKSIAFDSTESRYIVRLPWKEDKPKLENNYHLARARYDKLMKKLDTDTNLKERYTNAIQEMYDLHFIEEVDIKLTVNHPTFYLPHRPIVRESSTSTKVRPVFDGSAHGPNGVSLNDVIEPGPNLLPNLIEILLRFRRWRFALSADIQKAFLQISLDPADRDVHRFIWNDRVYRFRRVTFGVNASPFLLNATIRHHVSSCVDSLVKRELSENLYVDDLLSGADSQDELLSLFEDAKSIMSKAGMNLTKWHSNHTLLGDKLEPTALKVLGVEWSPESDVFAYQGLFLPEVMVPTKRIILSCIARLYDPLGFVAPFTMSLKILFQQVWTLGLDWDDELPEEIQNKFTGWIRGLDELRSLKIPRRYFQNGWNFSQDAVELHVYSDASEQGYGCVVYLKKGDEVTLVMSKARVAPLKRVTLPRLELLGCLTAARLVVFVRDSLRLPVDIPISCWSDSTVALSWIRGDPSRWKQFVGNRVREIQDLVPPSVWSHCPGKDNPADLLTRGMKASDLVTSEMWLCGPKWLATGDFPLAPVLNLEDCTEETTVLLTVPPIVVTPVLPFRRWSSFTKTIRVVGWLRRFVHNCGNRKKLQGDLSYEEMSSAKLVVFSEIQKGAYLTEIERLKSGKDVGKRSSLRSLAPFLDDQGLLRTSSRLMMTDLSYEERHPIILPKCYTSMLLVRHLHVLMHHPGVNSLVTSIRDSYHCVGARQMAKSVVKFCVSCRRQDSKSCNTVGAPLPADRVKPASPFGVVGIDFAGPLYCIDVPKRKFYICLFTCMVVRAVHLELTDSLSLESFLLAFKRFVSRRGLPSVIWSDNALTFTSANQRLLNMYAPNGPEWKFIVPRSPWWGGAWERLVRSTKSSLRKTLGTKVLTHMELNTLLCEVEATINSRPLTFVGDDSPQPLSPSHFLINRRYLYQPTTESPINDRDTLLERDKVRMNILNKFWQIWQRDYLRNLPVTVDKFYNRGALKVGDIVLIREDNIPRLTWPMGKVIKLYKSQDNVPRSALLKTSTGERSRPIQRLHSLEIVEHTALNDSVDPSVYIDDMDSQQETHREMDSDSQMDSTQEPSNHGAIDSYSPSDVENDSDENTTKSESVVKVSKYGRTVKPVHRLDL